MPKVSVYTQVYNAGSYLRPCISSVLAQTYPDFEYLIVDSASTDGSTEILKEFAEQDSRIKLTVLKENDTSVRQKIMSQYATGEFHTMLDHDDWWTPQYLENLLRFAEKNNLDIACTGTCMHDMATGGVGYRKLNQPLVLSRERFSYGLPWYYDFFRTHWGKLIRADINTQVQNQDFLEKVFYGSDTLYCFQLLRRAHRIGVDSSVLHHYRIHAAAMSYTYIPKRFLSDVYRYEDAVDFLQLFGQVSSQNLSFLNVVYANAILDDLEVIENTAISSSKKLEEYRMIAEHPLTQRVYRQHDECTDHSHTVLLTKVLQRGSEMTDSKVDFQAAVKVLAPCCGAAVTEESLELFQREPKLINSLVQDDRDAMIGVLTNLITEKKWNKKFSLGKILHSLLPLDSPLYIVDDTRFFRQYMDIVRQILKKNYTGALEEMTGLLLAKNKLYDRENFLQVYLTLAALENYEPAFVFGKVQLALLYREMGRRDDCQLAVDDLREMGLTNSEELDSLQEWLIKDREVPKKQ